MKKIMCVVLALISSLFYISAFAANTTDNKKPVTVQLPAGTSTADCSLYPTCITVTNYSSSAIDIYVPVLGFSSHLYPWYTQSIASNDYNYKQVILYDWTGYPFFNAIVPNHYDIIVEDFAGKAKVTSAK